MANITTISEMYNIIKEKMKTKGEVKTFREIYRRVLSTPTPREKFLSDMAVLTCSSERAVQSWANGTTTPPIRKQQAIAERFGVTPGELFPNEEEKGGKDEETKD